MGSETPVRLPSTLMMMIIMLNLLIAIISDAYDKAIATVKIVNNYELAKTYI